MMMMVVCSDVLDILKRPSCESMNMYHREGW